MATDDCKLQRAKRSNSTELQHKQLKIVSDTLLLVSQVLWSSSRKSFFVCVITLGPERLNLNSFSPTEVYFCKKWQRNLQMSKLGSDVLVEFKKKTSSGIIKKMNSCLHFCDFF